MRTIAVVAIAVVAVNSFAADSVERWVREHPQAHRGLLRVFEGHPNFTKKFDEETRDNSDIINDWINFLAKRDRRDTKDFLERKGREANGIRQLRENYGEHVRSFENWVRDNTEAATHLARFNGGVTSALREISFERDRDRRDGDRRK